MEGPTRKLAANTGEDHTAVGVQWIDQLTVKASDESHREACLWAFETVNPNAMPGATEHLASTKADFAVIQETKVARSSVNDVETAAGNAGWKLSLEACLHGDGGGPSAGAAVACRNHMGMSVSCDDDIIPEVLKGRFKLRLIGAVVRGGINFGSCYFHSPMGITATPNMNMLQAVAAVLSTLGGPWIIGADWNCTPDQLAKTGWPKMV